HEIKAARLDLGSLEIAHTHIVDHIEGIEQQALIGRRDIVFGVVTIKIGGQVDGVVVGQANKDHMVVDDHDIARGEFEFPKRLQYGRPLEQEQDIIAIKRLGELGGVGGFERLIQDLL